MAQTSAAESRAEKPASGAGAAKAAQAAQQSGGYFQQMGAAFSSSIMEDCRPGAVAATAIEALKGAADLTVAGAQAQQTRAAFEQLAQAAGTTGNALMTAMRKASGGEISDPNLQLAANKANLLGSQTAPNSSARSWRLPATVRRRWASQLRRLTTS